MKHICWIVTLISGLFCAESILGHARFTPGYPLKLRNPSDGLKDPANPCGAAPTTNAKERTVFKAGQQVEIVFEETIDHPAKYKIAFSLDETDNFNVTLMDLDSFDDDNRRPEMIPQKQDKDGRVSDRQKNPRIYRYTITIPETPCETCSLMLLQRMFDRTPPNNYFSCADIRIVPADSTDVPPEKPENVKVLKINGE